MIVRRRRIRVSRAITAKKMSKSQKKCLFGAHSSNYDARDHLSNNSQAFIKIQKSTAHGTNICKVENKTRVSSTMRGNYKIHTIISTNPMKMTSVPLSEI